MTADNPAIREDRCAGCTLIYPRRRWQQRGYLKVAYRPAQQDWAIVHVLPDGRVVGPPLGAHLSRAGAEHWARWWAAERWS